MIEVLADMPEGVLGLKASGTVTADDYKHTLSPALQLAAEGGAKLHVFLDYTAVDGMDAGAMWEDAKVGLRDWNSWERVALVTDTNWLRDGLRMFAWAMPGDAKAFSSSERDAALAWVADRSG